MPSGKPLINSERCKGCGLCIGACPKEILRFSDHTTRQGVFYPVCINEDLCTACKFCATICPEAAIEIFRYDGDDKKNE